MANVYAVKTGNWSDTTVWNTGSLPTSADNVYTNNFTVTIDGTFTVLTVSNAAQSPAIKGGGFILANTANLTCTQTVFAGVNGGQLFTFSAASPATATITAPSIQTSDAGTSTLGIVHSGTGTLYVNANLHAVAGSGRQNGSDTIRVTGGGTLQVIGTVYGGWASGGLASSHGIVVSTTAATISVFGNCYGNNYGAACFLNATGTVCTIVGIVDCYQGNPAVSCPLAATVNITGNILCASSQYTVLASTASTFNIVGNVIAGGNQNAITLGTTASILNVVGNVTTVSSGVGISSTGAAILNITGSLFASTSGVAVSSTSSSAINIISGPFISNTINGVSPFFGPVLRIKQVPTYWTFTTTNYAISRTMYTADYIGDMPTANNVRLGVAYGVSNNLVGTMAVPTAVSVAYGVPVDNTVGVAALSPEDVWNYLTANVNTANSIGERLKNCSTVETTGDQIASGL